MARKLAKLALVQIIQTIHCHRAKYFVPYLNFKPFLSDRQLVVAVARGSFFPSTACVISLASMAWHGILRCPTLHAKVGSWLYVSTIF